MGNEEELISSFLAIYFFLFLYGIGPPETSTLNSLGTQNRLHYYNDDI